MIKIINDNLFPLTRLFICCCKRLKKRILTRLFKKEIHEPWMPLEAVEIIKDIIKRLRPKKCLEWGMGYSTLVFSSLLEKDSIWYTIEHDGEWFNRISGYSKRLKNIKAFLVAPNNFPWTDENDDGSYSDLEDYINFPERYGKFNFILIDGRARLVCLSKAHEMLEDHGVVVLHDAERKYYHAAFKLYRYSILISEEPTSIWIGSNDPDINKVINADKYKKLWRLFSNIKRWRKQRRAFF